MIWRSRWLVLSQWLTILWSGVLSELAGDSCWISDLRYYDLVFSVSWLVTRVESVTYDIMIWRSRWVGWWLLYVFQLNFQSCGARWMTHFSYYHCLQTCWFLHPRHKYHCLQTSSFHDRLHLQQTIWHVRSLVSGIYILLHVICYKIKVLYFCGWHNLTSFLTGWKTLLTIALAGGEPTTSRRIHNTRGLPAW